MNYIFLDIDGVLNSQDYVLSHIDEDIRIDKSKVALLAKLVKKYNARIILSSSWRIRFEDNGEISGSNSDAAILLKTLFNQYNITIYSKTKNGIGNNGKNIWYFDQGQRADEIKDYINTNLTKNDNYIVFDDDDFGGTLKDFGKHFIKTSWQTGLTENNIKEAEYVLQKDRRQQETY